VGWHTTETVNNDSQMTVDHPRSYHGQTDLQSGVIDLNGLASADSYSFKNDMLSIYGSSGNLLDNVRFTADSAAFSVEKTSSGVSIYTADDTRHPTGNVMPVHS
jgi:hypothetical protein